MIDRTNHGDQKIGRGIEISWENNQKNKVYIQKEYLGKIPLTAMPIDEDFIPGEQLFLR